MPIIRIKSKGLPRAQYQNSQIVTSSADVSTEPKLIFRSPAMPDPTTDSLELSDEEKKEAAQQQNYQNWMQKPQNEMSVSSWAQPFQQKFDLNPQYDPNKKYNKKGNEIKPFNFNKFTNRVNNIGAWSNLGLNLLGAGVQYFDDRKKQKDWNTWFRQQNLPDNTYAVSPGNDRGDFDINEGIYRPNQLTPPNIGAAVAQFGGSMIKDTDMNLVKIKIKKTPAQMAYGGQAQGMALGLDLGQKDVYRHMPKEKAEYARSVIPEVPRDEANIEAEKGETVYGDLDGDGSNEHLKIGGKRHVDGGTPLNVPEGSFIFSDTKKMIIKDPNILLEFGMAPKKEGYTPAEIAKKYDVAKYKAIMEDPDTDSVRKSTAQLMIKNFEKKLAKLALIQESMKGFPQGVPKVALETLPEAAMIQESLQQTQQFEQGEEEEFENQDEMAEQEVSEEMPEARYGGLPRYQTAGTTPMTTDPTGISPTIGMNSQTIPQQPSESELSKLYSWYKPYTQSKTPGGRISRTTGVSTLYDPNVPNQYQNLDYWAKKAQSEGKTISNTGDLQRYIYQQIEQSNPSAINKMWNQYGPTLQSNKRNIENFADEMAGARTAYLLGQRPPEDKTTIGYICTGRDANGQPQIQSSSYMSPEDMAKAGAVSSEAEAEKQCAEQPQKGYDPNKLDISGKKKTAPFGWMTPDIVNMAAAAAIPPKKYLPYIASAHYEPGKLSLEDWRAQAAAEQSLYNKQAETMGVYGPTTGQAANQSSASGQIAERLGQQVIPGVTARNVDRLNQWMQGERQRKDQFNLLGANRATELYKGNVIANQQYDNAMRSYVNNMAKTFGQGWKNRMGLGMLNAVNPFYQVDPRSGRSFFTGKGWGSERLGSSMGTGNDFASINKAFTKAKGQLPDLTLDQFLDMTGMGKAPSKSSSSSASSYLPLYNMLMQGYGSGLPTSFDQG